jgi:hypothetical protein
MMALRCPGLSCEMLSPLALERDGLAIAAGFCLCRDSLVRADRLQRLRVRGRLRRRGSPLTGAVSVPPPSAATPST